MGAKMFIHFVKDRLSYVFFFIFSLLATDMMIWLDRGITIALPSLLYLNLFLLLSFTIFFIIRYKKETRFHRELNSLFETPIRDWQEIMPEPVYSSEQKV